MKEDSIFLEQLIDSMSSYIDKLEEAIGKNDIEESRKLKLEILKMKDSIDKELKK